MILAMFLWSLQAAPPAPQAAPPPDCSAAVHRQFDFWLGTWDVMPNGAAPAPGQKPATNVITRAHGDCVLVEQYTSPRLTGMSVNLYDRTRGQWHQTWVDSSGAAHDYWGGREGDRMVFHGTTPAGTSAHLRMRVRLTFFHESADRVRQFSERLNADGTWSVNYDLIYTRRKPS